ncbi:hypothetical protein KEM60_01330 [Austwickia sp. TVS 96-490-7B]|nr:hypothetical protein [Austwickia sp. TVS 96-490-7B]
MIRRDQALPSTRRIATESGIAEGTLFRAFTTKEALLDAIISATACPSPFWERTRHIDRTLPLRDRVYALAELLNDRFTEIFDVLGPLGVMGPPQHGPHPGCPSADDHDCLDPHHIRQHLYDVLGADAHTLRVPPDILVDALRFLSFAGSHPHINDGKLMTPHAIVDILLDGALPRAADIERPDEITALDTHRSTSLLSSHDSQPKGSPC